MWFKFTNGNLVEPGRGGGGFENEICIWKRGVFMRAAFGKFIKAFIARWGNGENCYWNWKLGAGQVQAGTGRAEVPSAAIVCLVGVYGEFTVDFAGGIRAEYIAF